MKQQREIKFRAWSKRDKCWCGAFSVHMSGLFTEITGAKMENGVCIAYADWIDLSKQEEITLMQYTGLKDKNGVEIFKSDILEFRNKENGELKHTAEVGQSPSGLWITVNDGLEIRVYECNYGVEIVGNIYENPELLTNPTK